MRAVTSQVLGLCVLAFVLASSADVQAQAREGDPLAYNLHVALFPIAFQAGVSQGYFGSAARVEYTPVRMLDLAVHARLPWWLVTGEREHRGFALGFGVALHLHDSLDEEKLGNSVYPADPPALSGPGSRGADRDLDVPTSTRLGGPPLAPDLNRDLVGLIYSVQLLRVGFSYVRTMETANAINSELRDVQNTLPLLHVGYGWGIQWNLPASLTGTPEIGYRRFFVDALLTLPALVKERQLGTSTAPYPKAEVFPVGARIGMEGSIDGLVRKLPGVGFAYSLELGALPAPRAVEGYMFVGLGLALDFAAH